MAAQADLIPDDEAARLLDDLIGLAARGMAGELTEPSTQSLTIQAVKSACALASRGTRAQAATLLDLLASEVPRPPGHHKPIDDDHANACGTIAATHPSLASTSLNRLFDLVSQGVQKASSLILEDTVGRLLAATSHRQTSAHPAGAPSPLTEAQRATLSARAGDLLAGQHHLADVILAVLDPGHPALHDAAAQASERILQRPEPDPHHVEFGSRMVEDSFLALSLDTEDRQTCLTKLLEIAADPREAAYNRQDALTGARNLVDDLPEGARHATFHVSKPFVLGEHDGSRLDDEVTGTSHPLSSFKITGASGSLRGHGLHLAAVTATTPDERQWVRDRALDLLHSDDRSIVQAAAVTLSAIRGDVTENIDINLLATHQHVGVRQTSAVLAAQHLVRHEELALRLARDSNHRVRRTLAEAVTDAPGQPQGAVSTVLDILRQDARHSVRAAAALRHQTSNT
ncbi:hypothetical protein [Streptomyces sp. NPDC006551]|uniref:hypothetical protein n=1 Tax=Streptomyces sp. NPDC006551 TaxID=3157178 RepID=UPI0033A843C2